MTGIRDTSRAEKMVAMYRQGITLARIGEQFEPQEPTMPELTEGPAMAIPESILSRVDEVGDCLVWKLGCVGGTEHPLWRHEGKTVLVRRLVKGFPPGRIVRCTCGTPKCVNPEHLHVTTYKKVAKQMGTLGAMSGRLRSAKIAEVKRRSKQAKITDADAAEIRASAEPLRIFAERLGINISTVSKIRRGQCRREFNSPWAGLGG